MAIRYSEYVKRPREEFEYSTEHFSELMDCSNNIWYFLKYVKVIHPDKGIVEFKPYSYQNMILELLTNNRYIIGLLSRQSGKALSLDTPIPMFDGTWKKMGDIKVNDLLVGRDGKGTKVTFITDIMNNHNCYEIEFDNGEKIIADEEHLWCVGSSYHKKMINGKTQTHLEKILTTKEIVDDISKNKAKTFYINYHNAIEYSEKNLLIDPYVLGVWLGDGDKRNGRITTHIDDYNEISDNIIEKYNISEYRPDKRRETTGYFTIYNLITDLKKINNCNNKHIPNDYLYSSINQRLELLRGLMDTDGYCDIGGSCEFYQKNELFIDNVRELLSGLGIKSRKRDKIVKGEKYFILSFTTCEYDVFKLKRKLDRQKKCLNHPKNKRIYIKNIIKIDSVSVKCIKVDNDESLFLCGKTMIPTHNTSVISVYALWYAIFNSNKEVGIVSNKQTSAIDILSRIKKMYEELPVWLKPGVVEYSKTFVSFDNGSKIMVSATSADAFRGRTLNLLVMDEFAFVPKAVAEEFWSANYPTISASQESKIIIISTPNGTYNLFHTIYSQAERNENEFKFIKSTWRDVPGRDEEWAKNQISNLGLQRFNQEYDVQFLGSSNTVIDPNILEILYTKTENPLMYDLNDRLAVYEKPELGSVYVIGVDSAKGTGENNSAIQILKLLSLVPIKYKQVAVFEDDYTDVYSFSEIINRLSIYYNNAHIMCENNAEGSAVVNRLWWEYENVSLVNTGSRVVDLGIRASRTTKPKAVLLMKKLIEDDCIEIVDKRTIMCLSSFIEDKGKFYGLNLPDDVISALYWATYFTEMDVLEETGVLKSVMDRERDRNDGVSEDEVWGIIADIEQTVEDWNWLTRSGDFRA